MRALGRRLQHSLVAVRTMSRRSRRLGTVSTPTSRPSSGGGVGDGGGLLLVGVRHNEVVAAVVGARAAAEHAEALGTGVGGAEALERQQQSEEAQRHHEEVRRAERGSVEPVRTKWLTVIGFWIFVLLLMGIANLSVFLLVTC